MGQPVRIVVGEAPAMVGMDACRALNIEAFRVVMRTLPSHKKGWARVLTAGGPQKVRTVTEGGLYQLAMRCDDALKPGSLANQFLEFATEEVFPQIRKTGRYEGPKAAEGSELPERTVPRRPNDPVWCAWNFLRCVAGEAAAETNQPAAALVLTEFYERVTDMMCAGGVPSLTPAMTKGDLLELARQQLLVQQSVIGLLARWR